MNTMAPVHQDSNDKLDHSEFTVTELLKCGVCNGFYGPNFGQPVCSTCHYFLFPNNINLREDDGAYAEKADSGDSGTEEPNAEEEFYVKRDDGTERVPTRSVEHVYAAPPKSDRLMERVGALSNQRDFSAETLPSGLVDSLPPEVLLGVFAYLDDISLWAASNVCSRWRSLLDASLADHRWHSFITLRWPLFNVQYQGTKWKKIYAKLLESAPCRFCLDSMMLQCTPPIEENSWRHRRLRSELKALRTDPPEGIQATPLDRHCCHWQASITGPHGSPYQGGLFFLYLQIPNSYPMRPPVVRFITRIFHPNISRHGDIGLDSIHHNWSLALTISKVLISIQSLLTDPYVKVCMEPAIGRLYNSNHNVFDRFARLWTWKYAMNDFLMPTDVSLNGN